MTTQMNDRPISTPTTLRFTGGWKNYGGKRLEFIQFQDRRSPEYREALLFKTDRDQIEDFWHSPFHSGGRRPRLGTRRRYRQEVEAARALVAFLGWDLTPEEEALLQAIEAYGREHAAERVAA